VALAITGVGALSSTGFGSRLALVGEGLQASSGYRLPEAIVGLEAFLSDPIAGAGLGQVVSGVFLSTFGITDVGPVYHAFYVTLLANGGLLALVAVLGALAPALRGSARRLAPQSLAFRCLLLGALAAAAFAGPTDGHWELGVLPALVLLAARPPPVATSPQRPRESSGGAGRPRPAGAGGPAPGARPPGASAIIVTYNSRAQIGACIEALLDSGVAVWVVDNASSDGTCALVRSRFPDVRVLANHANHGFAHAVNQALAEVQGDTVLLVNPDCVVAPGAVGAMTDHLRAHPGVGVVGPRLRDEDGNVAISAHPFETAADVLASRFGGSLVPLALRRFLSSGARRQSYVLCRDGDAPLPVDWLSGACLAIDVTRLRAVGGLDAGYFMYYEDVELCLQIHRLGAGVVYLPAAVATHVGGASSSDPAGAWPHLYRSMLRFHARHRPRTYPVVRAAILARAILGLGLGLPRDAMSLAQGRPGRRSLAWGRIARIALEGAPPAGRAS